MIRLHRPACPNAAALAGGDYKHPVNKAALMAASYEKCMYCESKVTHVYFGDVEHIKPKGPGLFPNLEFEWTNLGIVCAKCNNEKRNKWFADAPFIDPYSEDPSEHLYAYGELLWHRNGSERGEITHREIDLNRGALIERRRERLASLRKALDACHRIRSQPLREAALAELHAEYHPSKEYSIFAAALLQAHGNPAPAAVAV